MEHKFFNMDVHFEGGKVLKLGVEVVGGLFTVEEVQALYGTKVYPTAEKILVVPVEERPAPKGAKSAKMIALANKSTQDAVERVKKLQKDLKGLPDSVPPGRRQGAHFRSSQHDLPGDILDLMRETKHPLESPQRAEQQVLLEAPDGGAKPAVDVMNPHLDDFGVTGNPDEPESHRPSKHEKEKDRPSSSIRPDVKSNDPRGKGDPNAEDTFGGPKVL
jgi:hypothetical protein